MPEEGKNIRKYKSIGAEQCHPYSLSLDFECTLKKINHVLKGKTTSYIHEHIPNSFCFNSFESTKLVRCENVQSLMGRFNGCLIEYGKRYNELRRVNKVMIWDDNTSQEFEEAKSCHICNEVFSTNDIKVRDHCHVSGKFRGAACNKCNLNLKYPSFIPIAIHNLKYDSKIFLTWLLKLSNKTLNENSLNQEDIHIIPNTKEDYITFSKKVVVDHYVQRYNFSQCLGGECRKRYYKKLIGSCEECGCPTNIKEKGSLQDVKIEFRFIDTFRFMSTSLDKLVKSIIESDTCFCSNCKTVRDISEVEFLPIDDNNILKIKGNCKFCKK